ncbi:MAG: glycosyltransferase family 4 protein [Thermoanaerobaculia bacterium]
MRIAVVSDAWKPQVNGVVRTWENVRSALETAGHDLLFLHPGRFRAIPCPRYPSIELAVLPYRRLARELAAFAPQAVHIATEGPLGLAARRWCRRRGLPFTTSFHTQFAEYLRVYFGFPEALGYAFLHWFHSAAARTLVPTASVSERLGERGFRNLVVWGRGVDTRLFRPDADGHIDLPRPICLNVGRVAPEKNLAAFASLDLPGTKVIVGEGPASRRLRAAFPDVVLTGYLPDERLAGWYAAADVFVFPSRTDTFGNVMLESLASGTPVAAYPVTGPRDVLRPGETGVLDDDLGRAALAARHLDRSTCRRFAESLPWTAIADDLVAQLEPAYAS